MFRSIQHLRTLPVPVWIAAFLLAIQMIAQPPAAMAQAVKILAIGASNTNGKGVGRARAWPSQLQSMLRDRGHNVRVANNGVNGNTTSQILRRLPSALGSGTGVAIIAIPLTNDRRSGVNTNANIAAMRSLLDKRGVKFVIIDRPHQWAGRQMQADGIHFTTAGHRSVAAKLVPKVMPLLR